MNIHRPIFLLSILLRVARNAAKSALSSEPGNTIEAARAHHDMMGGAALCFQYYVRMTEGHPREKMYTYEFVKSRFYMLQCRLPLVDLQISTANFL